MNNFTFRNPVKILFGKNQISAISKELPEESKILITYGGGSIFKNGVYDKVKAATASFKVFEFGGIEPNPKFETLMKAVEICRTEHIDYLLAVGGGSVIDGTKFIAAATYYEGDNAWELLSAPQKHPISNVLPIGVVLTLPATGSEMNSGAVVSRKSTQEKLAFGSPLLYPKFSVLDPEVIFSLPDRQVANGIVDAFVHVIEQYLTYPVQAPLQDRFAESILCTLIEEGPKFFKDRKNYAAAANFMWCATMALNGLIAVGVPQDWATHMIGHELTAFHEIDHARTLAVVLPGVMHIRRLSKEEKLVQYAERVWGITSGTTKERIDQAISNTETFFHSLGIGTRLSDHHVSIETINKIVHRFQERGTVLGEKQDITPDEIRKILEDRL